MAERYAVQDGSWQNSATWDGGTVPGAGDDVHAGGYEVTIRDSIKVKSLRTAAGSSAPAGGRFVVGPMDIAPDTVIEVTDGILAAHHQSGNASTGARTYILWVLDAEEEITLVTPTIEGGAGQYRFGVGINVTGTSAAGTGGGEPVTIDVSAGAGLKGGGSTQSMALVVDAGSGGQDVTVLGNITGGSGSIAYGLNVTGGTVDITGDITGGGSSSAYGLSVTGGTVDITGDITGGGSSSAYGLNVTGGTVDITGDITGGGSSSAYGLSVTGGTVDITGDITGGGSNSAYGMSVTGGNGINITVEGDVYGSAAAVGLYSTGTNARVRLDGRAIAHANSPAIANTSETSVLAVRGPAIGHENGVAAIYARRWTFWDEDEFELHQSRVNWPTSSDGEMVILSRFPVGQPAPSDVRAGLAYGHPNDPSTGTLAVPPASSVAAGVPVDDTIGTGATSLADIAAVTGAQIAAATNND